jgi:hypothetical protein
LGSPCCPKTTARRCQQSMNIKIVALTDTWMPRHFQICVRSFKALPAHAQGSSNVWLVTPSITFQGCPHPRFLLPILQSYAADMVYTVPRALCYITARALLSGFGLTRRELTRDRMHRASAVHFTHLEFIPHAFRSTGLMCGAH